jgi:hypothetical protein
MSVCRSRELSADGWQAGSYLYFLCCAGDSKDVVYIKIGISDQPTRRLYALANGCALRPLTFGVCHIYSRKMALKMEREMHRTFKAWRMQGEWYRFTVMEKTMFATMREEILKPYRSKAWPLSIAVTGVLPVMRDARRRSLYFSRRLKRQGRAFHDFQHDSVA